MTDHGYNSKHAAKPLDYPDDRDGYLYWYCSWPLPDY